MDKLSKARRGMKRARTVYDREQTAGRFNLSAKQTRRMALASYALQRAAFVLRDAEQEFARDRIREIHAMNRILVGRTTGTDEVAR